MSFLGQYSTILTEINAAYLARTFMSSSGNPENKEQCAAYCQISSNDCIWYHFDGTTCFTGLLSYTGGSWGVSGTISVDFETNRMNEFINSHYTLNFDVQSSIWDVGTYQTKNIVESDECGTYCYLDTSRPCVGFFTEGSTCHLLDLQSSGVSADSNSKNIRLNSATISTWRDLWFDPWSAKGNLWPKYIYSILDTITDSYHCAMFCQMEESCQFHLIYNGKCHLGDCSVASPILGNQGDATIYYKDSSSSLSSCTSTFIPDSRWINQYSTYLYTYHHPSNGGLGECALICLLRTDERCHFYALNHGYCVFGDFRTSGNTILNHDWDDWIFYRNPTSDGKHI